MTPVLVMVMGIDQTVFPLWLLSLHLHNQYYSSAKTIVQLNLE